MELVTSTRQRLCSRWRLSYVDNKWDDCPSCY